MADKKQRAGYQTMGETKTEDDEVEENNVDEEATTTEPVASLPSDLGIEWLDGEIYVHGASFSSISSHARRKSMRNPGDTPIRLEYHVYDCILGVGFKERQRLLQNVSNGDVLRIVETVEVNKSEIQSVHDAYVASGYEGSMIRSSANTPYEDGKRSVSLLKKKNVLQEEFECTGFVEQKHESLPTLGSIVMRTKDGHEFRGRPAVTATMRQEIWDHQDEYLGKICTVQFDSYTLTNQVPRFPRVVGFRHPDDIG